MKGNEERSAAVVTAPRECSARAVSFGWERQNGLANRTGGQVRAGTVQTEYKQAQA